MKIAILNYNIGNLQSVKNALDSLNIDCEIIKNAEQLRDFDKAILPGVGAFGDAIKNLNQSNMSEAIKDFAKSGKYILGICLGMQLLMDKSYEFGEFSGLGLISGCVKKFNLDLKIPHIGWNALNFIQDSPLFCGLPNKTQLYFVHSFYVENADKRDVLATCDYGINFSAIISKNNIFGIQAHPEKSAKNGLKMLQNFINL